jgi:4-hydroxybenzoate polyprenyltransferase
MLWQQIRASRLHLAVCAAAGAWALPTFLGARPGLWPPVIAFALILALYQFNRLSDGVEDRLNAPQDYVLSMEGRRLIQGVAIAGLILAWGLATFGGLIAIAIVAAVSVGVFYGQSFGRRPRLKDRWYLKNILPAGAWALVMLGPGLAFAGAVPTPAAAFVFFYVTGAVWIVDMLNDLRDMLGDRARGCVTVPLWLGPQATIRFAQGFSLVLALGAGLMTALGFLSPLGWLLVYHGLALSLYAGVFGHSGYVRDSHTLTIANALHLTILGVASLLLR